MRHLIHALTIGIIITVTIIFNQPIGLMAASGTIKVAESHQTMVGFGASIAWYEGTLTGHAYNNEIYDFIFNELGLDVLRLRNTYRDGVLGSASNFAEIVNEFHNYSDGTPMVMISSWSPPAGIKSNNSINGGGNATLKKDPDTGNYMYGEFARYWVDALNAYEAAGIEPDYISIQNEPSFDAEWESCRFEPTERDTIAGYDQALDSVYAALQRADLHPQIIAAEAHGIGYNTFQNYANRFDHDLVDVYGYHLYHGASGSDPNRVNPDLFNANLTTIGNNYDDKPIFQTEYDQGDWFYTVWLIHDCLVRGNVSAYLWWELIWGTGSNPLVVLDGNNFELTEYYWAFRQYSKYISAGWVRVTADVSSSDLKTSAFLSPDGQSLTVVVINTGSETEQMSFNFRNFHATGGQVIRTSDLEEGEDISSNYDGSTAMDFPNRSITTIVFSGERTELQAKEPAYPESFSLSPNYPNPFNASTTINYSLASENLVVLKIFDVNGREVSTLVHGKMPAGTYAIEFDAAGLNSGVYFYQIQAGNFSQSRKMILLK
jgi:glucuronoarabinoxylan endo-1,4-beta-xylanase